MIAVIGRSYRLLGALLKRYYEADTEEVVAKLISGVTGNITMETNKRLWDLAQIARSSPSIAAILRENDHTQARANLQNSEEGLKFLQAMDQFLEEFGHREVHMDILYPTWCDDPEPVYSFIRSYLDADESQSPYGNRSGCQKRRSNQDGGEHRRKPVGQLILAQYLMVLKQTRHHTREQDVHFEMTRNSTPAAWRWAS
jgi:hypothetical protein